MRPANENMLHYLECYQYILWLCIDSVYLNLKLIDLLQSGVIITLNSSDHDDANSLVITKAKHRRFELTKDNSYLNFVGHQ